MAKVRQSALPELLRVTVVYCDSWAGSIVPPVK
jgi:hypothetical protein